MKPQAASLPNLKLISHKLCPYVQRAWIEFASSTLAAIAAFYSAADTQAFDRAVTVLHERFRSLETATLARPYFGGERFQLVDAAFGPVFRYFDVIDRHVDFGFFAETPRIAAWRNAVSTRPSVEGAVAHDYAERLHRFLATRNSVLADLIGRASVPQG